MIGRWRTIRSAVTAVSVALVVLAPVASSPATDGAPVLPSDSVYNLKVVAEDHNGDVTGLDQYYGQPTLVTMFYASCPHVCPMLISTIKLMESKLSPQELRELRVLAISIDPERDTPAHLRDTMSKHSVDADRWTLVRPQSRDLRSIAAVAGVKYKKLPDGEFSHSTKIILLDREGRQVDSSNRLGRYDPEFLEAIRKSTR